MNSKQGKEKSIPKYTAVKWKNIKTKMWIWKVAREKTDILHAQAC